MMTLEEIKTAHRCCGRCGITWSDYLKECAMLDKSYCIAWGRNYGIGKHVWIWWEPAK